MTNEKIETDNLLFSVVVDESQQDVSATEALMSFGVFQPSENGVQPLFDGNVVGKPIPVMVEGAYYVSNKGKYREVKFSAVDIERLAKRQPRDVPFNYDHRRAPGRDGVKGWLRFGEGLHYVGKIKTPDGDELTALFATPELSQEAQELVKTGIYRDVSVEYRQLDDVLTGVALTSYPVMRNLQFSELEASEEEATEPTQVEPVLPDTPLANEEITTPEEEMDVNKLKELPKEDKKAALDALLGEFGLDTQALVQMGENFANLKEKQAKTEKELALAKAETEILEIVGTNHFGLTDEIATDAQEILAWTALNEELKFGADDSQTPDVAGTVKGLLGVIAKQGAQLALLGGESELRNTEDGKLEFGSVEENVENLGNADEQLDNARVNSLTALAKSYL